MNCRTLSAPATSILCRVLLFLLCFSAYAADRTIAQYVHRAWVGKDGAPANITAITQTKDGYLWLASSQGLYRFDGVEFERFKLSGQPLTSAPTDALLSCPSGDLWVASAVSEVSLLRNGATRNFTAADGFPEGAVLSLAEDRQGGIWAATQGGLVRFDGAKWRKVGAESGFDGVPISLYFDHGGTLWASTPEGVFHLLPGAARFVSYGTGLTWVMQMLDSPHGTLWMAQITHSVRPMQSGKGPEFVVSSQNILFDREGGLWITSRGGGLRRVPYPGRLPPEQFGGERSEIESFKSVDGLSSDYVESVYQDREGTIWAGTAAGLDRLAKGAIVHAPAPAAFALSTMAPGKDGDVWVGGLTGKTGWIQNNQWHQGPAITVFSIVPDPDGGTWWSAFGGLGYREIDGRFTIFDFPPAYVADRQPRLIALDRSGALWLAGSSGISLRRGGKWEAIDLPAGFPGKNVKVAYTDPAGRVWFGYREDSILLIENSVRRVFSAADGLRVGAVEAIFTAGAVTWISGSQGLQLFDGRHFREITPAGGETFGSVSGVLETADGSLWLNAVNGIVRIAPPEVSKLKRGAGSAEYTIFDAFDGLPGATQQQQPFRTLVQATDGKLWFGNSGGPVRIDPTDLPRNNLPPPVAFRSLTANGKRYAALADLRLPALTHDVEIDYTALSFVIPERVRFRYRLAGSDKNWREAGTRRQAFYTNLGPGEYHFRVTACNNDGVWNEAGAGLNFSIEAAFYQTHWFQAILVAVVLAMMWGVYRYRLRLIAHEFDVRLEERVAERTRVARDLHDTLLQSFQGLMLRLQAVGDMLPEGKARERLEQSLQRGDQAIAEGRSAVYDLRSVATSLKDLAQAVQELGDELVNTDSATFRLVVEGTARDLHPLLRDETYRVAREALRNAFLHALAHRIETEISYGDRVFRLRVRDDGKGIPREFLETGRSGHYGLSGMRERARQIGGKLDIWSGAGAGTEIEFTIASSIAYSPSAGRRLFRFGRKRGGS